MIAELKTPAIERAKEVLLLPEMSIEQYEASIRNISQEKEYLSFYAKQLRDKLISQSKFKVRDKVLVTNGYKKTEAFIGFVDVDFYGKHRYTFCAVKKNGEMSRNHLSLSGYTNIELINPK